MFSLQVDFPMGTAPRYCEEYHKGISCIRVFIEGWCLTSYLTAADENAVDQLVVEARQPFDEKLFIIVWFFHDHTHHLITWKHQPQFCSFRPRHCSRTAVENRLRWTEFRPSHKPIKLGPHLSLPKCHTGSLSPVAAIHTSDLLRDKFTYKVNG